MSLKKGFLWFSFVIAANLCFFLPTVQGEVDVCSKGTGLPPFLSSGVDPNLLLVLDNSGSMLDMAYIDPDTDGLDNPLTTNKEEGTGDRQDQCFDQSYLLNNVGAPDPTRKYAGNYEPSKWYLWTNDVPFWESGVDYKLGAIVQENQIYYKAIKAGSSTGHSIDTDIGVNSPTWQVLYQIKPWQNKVVYPAHSFVRVNGQFYYTKDGGTSNDSDLADGLNIEDDLLLKWEKVDSTWHNGVPYAIDAIVSYRGMLYKATTAGTANDPSAADGLSLDGDTGVSWTLLDTSSFQPVDETTAQTSCTGAAGTKYSNADLCVTVASVSVNNVSTPYLVTAFSAKGNFLNWASASKFDIEKTILTGGKYDSAGAYDNGNNFIISENRGCAGKKFVKQVNVSNGGVSSKLTLSVSGPSEEGRTDTTDDITRIAILGISTNGFEVTACQAAIAEMEKESPNLGQLKSYVDECLGYNSATASDPLTLSSATFNHSLQFCWYLKKHSDYQPGQGDVTTFKNDCEAIYNVTPAPTINPWDSPYICYGVYDSSIYDINREGYVGRCWEPAALPAGCKKVTCKDPDGDGPLTKDEDVPPQTSTKPYIDPICGRDGFVYFCDGTFNKNVGCGGNPGEWKPDLVDANPSDGVECNPAGVVTEAIWTDDMNQNTADNCVIEAAKDYCGYLSIPEVIDPSDQVSETGEFWNIPAVLIDSGVVAQMGTNRPLATMKGIIQYELPVDQTDDAEERPNGPRGVLYDVAEDIRLGVMVLNDNGADTECNLPSPDPSIVKYCPEPNRDGARVITQIKEGMTKIVDPGDPNITTENWEHYTKLVSSINDTRATSWTPLAEAMYTALSYYGQNKIPRLQPNPTIDFKLPNEGTIDKPWTDPVQYWCQDNHVLIITEGASTADVNATVATFANQHLESGETAEAVCPTGLNSSPFLDNITYFGQNATVEGETADASDIYSTLIATNKSAPEPAYAKQPVTTHIITTGSLRTDGTGECSPATLMTNAAKNGGSSLLTGEDPGQLEANLKSVLSGIMGRASAGSAASVISSSRSGEGAVYQAVFWPKVDRALGKDPLTWIGDVHGLFIDNQGRMWDDNLRDATLLSEDKNGNGRLDAGEDIGIGDPAIGAGDGCLNGDRRVFFYYDGENSKICFNDSVLSTDPPVCNTAVTGYCQKAGEPLPIKTFDKYLWSANQALQNIAITNIHTNRKVSTTVGTEGRWVWNPASRYIFTWNDLDNDGIVDSDGKGGSTDEIIPIDDTVKWAEKTITHHSILHDFKVTSPAEMGHLRDWLRGLDTWYEVDTDSDNYLDAAEDLNNNGVRDYVYRCRRGDCDPANEATNPEWRLGDVVHSTPKLVAQPAEAFHTIYRDPSYSSFVKRHRYRRNVIYFGANDGMLHAVNGGFYKEKDNKFYKNMDLADDTGDTDYNDNGPELGTELWAYIPYNLQPHLKCLTDPLYGGDDGNSHKYFVDKEPRIFDMQIFTEETVCTTDPYDKSCIHPKGWGTILVGAMRFGGAPVTAATDGAWAATDNRQFISSYFILDITDPERPPKLLGEMTRTTEIEPVINSTTDATIDPATDSTTALATDSAPVPATYKNVYTELGFSTPMPSGVVMKDTEVEDGEKKSKTNWYLVFGNGPTTIKGENSQMGKVAVLPMKLDAVSGVLENGFRIPDQLPNSSTGYAGVIPVQDSATDTDPKNRFISDMMTVDYDLESKTDPTYGALYKSDAVYFGTVDGTTFTEDASNPGITTWNGGGGIYRLVTEKITLTADGPKQEITTPDQWYISKFVDTEAPVTGGLSVGWDNANFWIYFGTGRYFTTEDKTDATIQRFFGVKEPLYPNCGRTWGPVSWSGMTPTPTAAAGLRGLVRTDNINVVEKGTFLVDTDSDGDLELAYDDQPVVFCPSGTLTDITLPNYCSLSFLDSIPGAKLAPVDGTPAGITYYSYDKLKQYIAGEDRDSLTSCPQGDATIGVDGWYRVLQDSRERVTGQSALLGGLVTFTTYQPYDDLCIAEGMSNLYGVHYQTGTAWYENVFGTTVKDSRTVVLDKLSLGVGLATTPSIHSGGGAMDAKAFIQSSTGEIIEIGQENLPIKPPKSGPQSWCDDCD